MGVREEPGMTAAHNQIGVDLAFTVMRQLDRDEYTVRLITALRPRAVDPYGVLVAVELSHDREGEIDPKLIVGSRHPRFFA